MEFSKDLLGKTLISIFEKDCGRKITDSERNIIEQIANDTLSTQEVDETSQDDEITQLLREEELKTVAQSIREVVVGIVDAINGNSSYYKVRKNIPLIKEAHSNIINYVHTDLFPQIIDYAKEDMFYGDMPILGDQTQYLEFFHEYIDNPEKFSVLILKDRASRELVAYLEKAHAFDS